MATVNLEAIEVSSDERAHRGSSPSSVALAGAILACRGYVVLKNAIEPERIDAIAAAHQAIYDDCRSTCGGCETPSTQHSVPVIQRSNQTSASFWYRRSRWRIFPRLTGPMADPRLLANPYVVPILRTLLGEDFSCRFVSSDTCVAGSILQSPHSDIVNTDVFEHNRWRARGYIVNVPTMECGLHNGPLEIWPGGSHLWADELVSRFGLSPYVQDGRNPPVERLSEYLPSQKIVLHPGEILIRDPAMWHRGTPNPTAQPRTMLTLGYFRSGQAFGYGDLDYNLDRALFRQLHPSAQRMFSDHFSVVGLIRRKEESLRSVVREARTRLKGLLKAA